MKLKVSVLVLCCAFLAFTTDNKEKIVSEQQFRLKADSVSLSFEMPADYKPAPICDGAGCVFAIRNRKQESEIRYFVTAASILEKKFNDCNSKATCLMPAPEKKVQEDLVSLMLNISGSPDYLLMPLDSALSRSMFNADAATLGTCTVSPNYADFRFAEVIHMSKAKLADVAVVRLYNHSNLNDTLSNFSGLMFR